MADRGRVGSLVVGCKSAAEKIRRKDQELHRERVRRVKPATDMSVPVTAGMDHFRMNLKKERLLEERYIEIDRENKVLLQKMAAAMKKPNPYKMDGKVNRPTSLNRTGRKAELLRITADNQRMLKAIQQAQPVYNHKKWEDNYRKSEVLLRNVCEFPVITRLARTDSAPSVLMRLRPERPSEGPGDQSPSAHPAEDQQYVFKESRRVGEAYYMLEMSTDGRVLNISAYDTESQTSLELLVKEKVHRQLYREFNSDYGLIADRLRVEGNRLILEMPGTS